jgi:hypothetical protein
MKQLFSICFCLVSGLCIFSQQNRPIAPSTLNKENGDIDKEKEKGQQKNDHFFFYGIGNLSDETLNKLNGGAKLALAFHTLEKHNVLLPSSYFLSFNKNATNTDSLLVSTLVFPEVGSHSFLATAYWDLTRQLRNDTTRKQRSSDLSHSLEFFFEFATKRIDLTIDSTNSKSSKVGFNTLHYTGGFRFSYGLSRVEADKKYNAALGGAVFISNTNIPDEDNAALETITNGKVEKNSFWSVGVKLGIEVNGFQLFADLRHVFGDDKKLPIKDLKGFNSNIGVAFNTEIFHL